MYYNLFFGGDTVDGAAAAATCMHASDTKWHAAGGWVRLALCSETINTTSVDVSRVWDNTLYL